MFCLPAHSIQKYAVAGRDTPFQQGTSVSVPACRTSELIEPPGPVKVELHPSMPIQIEEPSVCSFLSSQLWWVRLRARSNRLRLSETDFAESATAPGPARRECIPPNLVDRHVEDWTLMKKLRLNLPAESGPTPCWEESNKKRSS